jgi:sialate O-acetylesterase
MNSRHLVLSMMLFLVCLNNERLSAELKLPSFFSDNMVLQRDKAVSIWGWTDPNTKVALSFHGKSANTTSNESGRWQVELPAMSANAKGQSLVIESGGERIEIKNVLIGEVWFAGGQSNMAFILKRSLEAEADIAAANYPGIRMFLAANTAASTPQTDIRGSWHVCTPETADAFSAVAYFFAKRIYEETGIPVGVIKSCWGGKRAETYTSREALLSNEHGKKMIADLDQLASEYNAEKKNAAYEKALAQWKKSRDTVREFNKGKEKTTRKKFPRQPKKPKPVYENERNPTVLYNGMIHPFVGYSMRGAIWYQGEANAKPELAELYLDMFSLMINDWRSRWNDEFDFYFVQLANFQKPTTKPGAESNWATVQDHQRRTLALAGTGMATINDVGAANDIHPKDKKTVGNRLALWALNRHHDKDIVVSGPLYKSHSVDGNQVKIEFDHVGGGLKSRDDKPLKRFEISNDGKTWHWATAKIDGDSIVVECSDVSKPVAARYAWTANPEGANLINEEGLPASIFQTK